MQFIPPGPDGVARPFYRRHPALSAILFITGCAIFNFVFLTMLLSSEVCRL